MSFNGLRLEYALEGSSNYIAWKDRMEAVLDDNGLKEFIDTDIPKPTDATQADAWQKKIAKCRRILLEGVKDHIVSSLHGKATPYLMWKSLTELFQSKSDQRKLALKDKLRNIKCEKGDSIPKYLTKFTQCRDELGSVGVTVDDEDLVSLALLGLPKSWHSYQDSVNGREKLPGWERLWSDLVQEEIRRSTRDGSSSKGADEENCALAAKAKKGKSKKASQSGAKGKKQDMSKVKCFHCHQHGHYATNCPQKKKNKQAAGSAGGEALASQFELDFSLIACLVSSVMGSVWFLDSGASFHMTGDRDLFSDLEDKDLGVHIEMGDDGRYSATGIGTISFERESGKPFVLKEVMHVPGLKKNLISVAMLEDKGYDVVFSEGKAFLRSKTTGETRKIGVRVRNLYQLHVDGCAAMAGKAEGLVSRDDGELWHRRLGHLHHGALKILQQITTGLPKGTLAQSDQCKGCTLGKFVKATFHEKDSRATTILERIHTDVCGPFSVASTAKHRYYVIFVDDFSRKCWIFFMQKKSETYSKFCEFKALVEKESGKKVKALRSDNGGEYISDEFKDFCKAEGIRRELIAPHNPQQNGVAERKNRTIVGAARAMLHDQGLPLHLWAEACNTAVYVQNRCPHRILGMSTPEETYSGKKPDLSHLRIFGANVYMHVTKDARKKLEPTAEVGIFVGYTDTPHNYRVYLPDSGKTVVRRDIKFQEEKAMKCSLERELHLHADEELLVPKDELQDVDQPQDEVHGVEETTHAAPTIRGRKRLTEAERLAQDAEKVVGPPTAQRRQRQSPDRYTGYMALMSKCVVTEPSSFEEAVEDPAWVDAMVEEYDSIVRNSAWEIVPRPEGKSVVGSRWIYKVKQAADGSVEKYKARFVARGFSQIEGIDYEETFAPVARYSSIRTILALSAQMGWHIHQMDVKTAFLNGVIEEEVYIEQPEGFEVFSSESHVCRLKRALYGLKQAPRAWYTRIDSYFTGLGFSKSEADPNLYQIVVEGKLLIIVLYVDDLILTGDELLILSCKKDLATEFEMKDLGLLHYFLGLEIWQRSGGLFVSQGKYAREILEKFNMHGCKPVDTPLPGGWRKEDATSGEEVDATVYRQLVGSLMYLVNTRPDICYAVNQLSQAMVKPTKLFWKAGKHVLRYLRGTSGYGLWYRQEDEVKLCGFTDADWAGSPTDRKSTSGGVFSIGSTTVSWYSRKQRSVALSSAEAEYMAASLAACEAIWMRKILVGLFGSHLDPTVIYCDNQSCIKLSANPVFHDRSKHIDIRYHHIRDCVQRRIMLLSYIPTEDQDADILTKALTRSKFEYHRGRIGVADNPYLVEREC